MDKNDFMKLEEVMEYLDIGKNSMYKLLGSGELGAFKIGKVWKIPRVAVEDYVKRQIKKTVAGR